jgi:WD40 repeat protein
MSPLRLFTLACCGVFLGAEPVLPAGPALDAKQIAKLIEQLGNDDFKTREDAAEQLEKIGVDVKEALQRAAESHDDVEVRQRCRALILAIDKKYFGELLVMGGLPHGYWVNRVVFAADGKHALAAGGGVMSYDLSTGEMRFRGFEVQFARQALALSPDGKSFLTGHDNDQALRLGDVQTGKEIAAFVGHTAGIQAVAFSPDGKQVLSGGKDQTIRLWDVATRRELRSFANVADTTRALAFSSDGKQVLSGHQSAGDGLLRLWDVQTGKEVRRFKGHSREVTGIFFLPGGRNFLSASMDGTVREWELATGKELRCLTRGGAINSAALSADGKRLLTASPGDTCARLWDVATGREIHCYRGHDAGVLGVAFSPDGKRILSSDASGTVRLWRAEK